MSDDHYEVLGVAPHADGAELRAAYLGLMRRYHPDLRPGEAHAEARAKQANAAWEVLGDAGRRATYDRGRAARGGHHHHGRDPLGTRPVAFPRPAYSGDGTRYRRAFSIACLRLGWLVCAAGVVLLLAFSAG
jgi:curved DNA-binding protein CbpA